MQHVGPAYKQLAEELETHGRTLAEAVLLAVKPNPSWGSQVNANPAAKAVRACLSDTPPNGPKAVLHGCEVYSVSPGSPVGRPASKPAIAVWGGSHGSMWTFPRSDVSLSAIKPMAMLWRRR